MWMLRFAWCQIAIAILLNPSVLAHLDEHQQHRTTNVKNVKNKESTALSSSLFAEQLAQELKLLHTYSSLEVETLSPMLSLDEIVSFSDLEVDYSFLLSQRQVSATSNVQSGLWFTLSKKGIGCFIEDVLQGYRPEKKCFNLNLNKLPSLFKDDCMITGEQCDASQKNIDNMETDILTDSRSDKDGKVFIVHATVGALSVFDGRTRLVLLVSVNGRLIVQTWSLKTSPAFDPIITLKGMYDLGTTYDGNAIKTFVTMSSRSLPLMPISFAAIPSTQQMVFSTHVLCLLFGVQDGSLVIMPMSETDDVTIQRPFLLQLLRGTKHDLSLSVIDDLTMLTSPQSNPFTMVNFSESGVLQAMLQTSQQDVTMLVFPKELLIVNGKHVPFNLKTKSNTIEETNAVSKSKNKSSGVNFSTFEPSMYTCKLPTDETIVDVHLIPNSKDFAGFTPYVNTDSNLYTVLLSSGEVLMYELPSFDLAKQKSCTLRASVSSLFKHLSSSTSFLLSFGAKVREASRKVFSSHVAANNANNDEDSSLISIEPLMMQPNGRVGFSVVNRAKFVNTNTEASYEVLFMSFVDFEQNSYLHTTTILSPLINTQSNDENNTFHIVPHVKRRWYESEAASVVLVPLAVTSQNLFAFWTINPIPIRKGGATKQSPFSLLSSSVASSSSSFSSASSSAYEKSGGTFLWQPFLFLGVIGMVVYLRVMYGRHSGGSAMKDLDDDLNTGLLGWLPGANKVKKQLKEFDLADQSALSQRLKRPGTSSAVNHILTPNLNHLSVEGMLQGIPEEGEDELGHYFDPANLELPEDSVAGGEVEFESSAVRRARLTRLRQVRQERAERELQHQSLNQSKDSLGQFDKNKPKFSFYLSSNDR